MLLTALSGVMPDFADAVCVGERSMSREALFGAAAALAERIGGASSVAVAATASMETVVGVVAGVLAGVLRVVDLAHGRDVGVRLVWA